MKIFLAMETKFVLFGGTSKPPSNWHRCSSTLGLLNSEKDQNKKAEAQTSTCLKGFFVCFSHYRLSFFKVLVYKNFTDKHDNISFTQVIECIVLLSVQLEVPSES